MRGLGNVYRRGSIWWIRYHHLGREYRESAQSQERADAVRLLKRRLADLSQGKPCNENRVTFEQLAEDYIQESTLRGVPPSCLQWSKARVANLTTSFAGTRAAEITTPAMREYAKARR